MKVNVLSVFIFFHFERLRVRRTLFFVVVMKRSKSIYIAKYVDILEERVKGKSS